MPANDVLRRLLDQPASWQWLDPVAGSVKSVIDTVLAPDRLRSLLQGRPVGHPAHPPLAQLTLAGLSGSALLAVRDLHAGDRVVSDRPIFAWLAIASAAPTAAAGWSDWSDLHEDQQRTGLVHAATMSTALSLALLARLPLGRRTSAVLDLAAGLIGTVGSALGGHLAFRWAAGVNHSEAFAHLAREDWTRACLINDLVDRRPMLVTAGDEPVILVSVAGRVHALADRCSHLGGPLHEGTVVMIGQSECLECPWHSSAFALDDGAIQHGPATSPQPDLETRVSDGWVEVRPRRLPGVPGR